MIAMFYLESTFTNKTEHETTLERVDVAGCLTPPLHHSNLAISCNNFTLPRQAKGNSPWNLSFSWSQALQLPLLELCKKNPPGSDLPLAEMTALLEKELIIAGAAARGEYDFAPGQGDHN